jgi:hypothetical protein
MHLVFGATQAVACESEAYESDVLLKNVCLDIDDAVKQVRSSCSSSDGATARGGGGGGGQPHASARVVDLLALAGILTAHAKQRTPSLTLKASEVRATAFVQAGRPHQREYPDRTCGPSLAHACTHALAPSLCP